MIFMGCAGAWYGLSLLEWDVSEIYDLLKHYQLCLLLLLYNQKGPEGGCFLTVFPGHCQSQMWAFF